MTTRRLLSIMVALCFLLSQPYITKADNKSLYVSTANEFVNALGDSSIEQIYLENDIKIDEKYSFITIVGKKKVINGNGFSLFLNNQNIKTWIPLNFHDLKESTISLGSVGNIVIQNVKDSEIIITSFINSITINNSSLLNSKLTSEEYFINNSTLKNTTFSSLYYPLKITNSTLIDSPITTGSNGSLIDNVKFIAKDKVPLTVTGDTQMTNVSIESDADYGLVLSKGALTLNGKTTIKDANKAGITIKNGSLYVQGNIYQIGNSYTIQTENRENIFTTQVHDLYENLTKGTADNLLSYYNTNDREGNAPNLPNKITSLTELKPVSFSKQDYNEIVGYTDNQENIIMVKDGLGNSYHTRPDRFGEFSIILPAQPKGSTIYVYAFSPNGIQSKVQKFSSSINATDVPLYVSSIYNTEKVATGKTASNALIYVRKNKKIIGKGRADSDGFFRIPSLTVSAYDQVEIYAQNTVGKTSTPITKIVDTPFLSTEKMKSEKVITGTIVSVNTTKVEAFIQGKSVGKSSAKKGTPFKITLPSYKPGTAVEVITYNNDRKLKDIIKISDLTPPSIKFSTKIDDNDNTIKGQTEKSTAVKLYINNKYEKSTTSDKNGNFKFSIAKKKAGTRVKIIAIDRANNQKTYQTTVLDKTAPIKPTINSISDTTTLVSGKTEANTSVKLYVNNKYQKKEISDKNGKYTFKISKKKAGLEIKVTATDKSNNTSSTTKKVVDKTAPNIPSINKVTSKSKTVTGKGEKSATVYIYNGKTKIASTTVNSKGQYKVSIKPQKKGSKLSVYAKDKAGNKSKIKYIKVS